MISPSVSVLIPCFNQGRFVARAIECALGQTHQPIECVVVDDGSTDDTFEVATALAAQDPRVRVLRQENAGASAARNAGLDALQGEFFQLLDADDVIYPTKIERQLDALRSVDRPAVATCGCLRRWEDDDARSANNSLAGRLVDGVPPAHDLARRWETHLSIPIHSFLFSAELFNGPSPIRFDETLENHVDFECWVRLFLRAPNVVHVPEVLAEYRFHDEQMTRDLGRMREGFLRAIDRLEAKVDDAELVAILEAKRPEIVASYERLEARRRRAMRSRRLHRRVARKVRSAVRDLRRSGP